MILSWVLIFFLSCVTNFHGQMDSRIVTPSRSIKNIELHPDFLPAKKPHSHTRQKNKHIILATCLKKTIIILLISNIFDQAIALESITNDTAPDDVLTQIRKIFKWNGNMKVYISDDHNKRIIKELLLSINFNLTIDYLWIYILDIFKKNQYISNLKFMSNYSLNNSYNAINGNDNRRLLLQNGSNISNITVSIMPTSIPTTNVSLPGVDPPFIPTFISTNTSNFGAGSIVAIAISAVALICCIYHCITSLFIKMRANNYDSDSDTDTSSGDENDEGDEEKQSDPEEEVGNITDLSIYDMESGGLQGNNLNQLHQDNDFPFTVALGSEDIFELLNDPDNIKGIFNSIN